MIVVMKPGASPQQLDHIVKLVREMGLKDHVIVGTERTVVAVIGDDRFKDKSRFESVEGVDKVVPILAPYKMASVEMKKERTSVTLGAAGAIGLRGGAFKPRTSPYAFQGLAEEGLKYLAEAREKTGLAIVTEVMSIEQIPACVEYADVLQIGARNMQNFNLLSKVGETTKPVLLKRGMSATL